MTIQNLGFRCAADVKRVKKKPEVVTLPPDADAILKKKREDAQKEAAPLQPEAPKRVPRKHFYNETWEYKIKQVLEDVAGGDIKDSGNVLKRLKGDRGKKDEL